jgi:ferritin-like metal-binding protein YciE
MASLDSLETLLQEELKDIYDAEKQLTKALPKLAKKASAGELKDAFEEHLLQTEQHVERLEEVFGELDLPARGKRCEGMKHLIAEGDAMIGDAEDDETRDALMVAAAQKVEHYEIAAYGTLRTWATLLGKDRAASLLEETLEEEKETDRRLTSIAESFINEAAAERDVPARGRAARARQMPARGAARRTSRTTAADRGARSKKARSR